eukprot:4096727-Karenia_brevis.AAC.1
MSGTIQEDRWIADISLTATRGGQTVEDSDEILTKNIKITRIQATFVTVNMCEPVCTVLPVEPVLLLTKF